MVDGSLRDAQWFGLLFQRIRAEHPRLSIAIVHVVTAPERVLAALEQVPKSVEKLAALTDYNIGINMDGPEPAISTEHESWTTFSEKWMQQCEECEAVPCVSLLPKFSGAHGPTPGKDPRSRI